MSKSNKVENKNGTSVEMLDAFKRQHMIVRNFNALTLSRTFSPSLLFLFSTFSFFGIFMFRHFCFRPKLGLPAERPCKIQHFHRDPFRHSLENLGWPSKLYRSMQHFMHYRLVTDSRVVVDQKLGFGPKNHIRYMIFIVILAAIRLRIWVDLLNYTDRRTILCSIDRWQIQEGLWAKNRGLQGKNLLKYLFSRKSLQILVSVCARVLYLLCRRRRLGSSEW